MQGQANYKTCYCFLSGCILVSTMKWLSMPEVGSTTMAELITACQFHWQVHLRGNLLNWISLWKSFALCFFCIGTISQLSSMLRAFAIATFHDTFYHRQWMTEVPSTTMAELVTVLQFNWQVGSGQKIVNWISLEMFQFSIGFLLNGTICLSLLHFRMYFNINNEMAHSH